MDVQVSYYRNMFDTKGVNVGLNSILSAIKNGKWEDVVNKHRSKQIDGKKVVPCFAVGGVFSPTRSNNNCIEPSGVLSIDLDAVEEGFTEADVLLYLDELPESLGTSVISVFNSLGGGGCCFLIKIPKTSTLNEYKERYRAVYNAFESAGFGKIGVLDDLSDLSRLRFISNDKNIYINPSPSVFKDRVKIEEDVVLSTVTYNQNLDNSEYIGEQEQIDVTIKKYVEEVGGFGVNGKTRHDWILGVARWLCRAGVEQGAAYNYLVNNFINSDRPSALVWSTEVKRAVKSSYNTYSAEQGNFRTIKRFSCSDIKACMNGEEVKEQLLFFMENKKKLIQYLVNNKKETKFVEEEIEFIKYVYSWIR